MLRLTTSLVLTLAVSAAGSACAQQQEPVIGGPCEGCELVFEGLPDHLSWHARIALEDEPGEPLRIEGTVTDAGGRPAAGVIVYAYHTDTAGTYPPAATRHGRLRGWARTDAAGRYRFDTIRPGAYPERTNPQHVHMHVIEPDVATYWIASIHFTDDPLLDRTREAEAPRGGSGIVTPSRNEDGTWRVRRDIVLGEGVPGYRR